jgi:hypothetical protein
VTNAELLLRISTDGGEKAAVDDDDERFVLRFFSDFIIVMSVVGTTEKQRLKQSFQTNNKINKITVVFSIIYRRDCDKRRTERLEAIPNRKKQKFTVFTHKNTYPSPLHIIIR